MRITKRVLDETVESIIELAESRGVKYVDIQGRYPVANMYIYTAYDYPTLVARMEDGTGVTNDICTARDNKGIYQWLRGFARALHLMPEVSK